MAGGYYDNKKIAAGGSGTDISAVSGFVGKDVSRLASTTVGDHMISV